MFTSLKCYFRHGNHVLKKNGLSKKLENKYKIKKLFQILIFFHFYYYLNLFINTLKSCLYNMLYVSKKIIFINKNYKFSIKK